MFLSEPFSFQKFTRKIRFPMEAKELCLLSLWTQAIQVLDGQHLWDRKPQPLSEASVLCLGPLAFPVFSVSRNIWFCANPQEANASISQNTQVTFNRRASKELSDVNEY
ncbi:hypothetical protein RBWH47_05699 [Rhodopirellula baltica WH47]|uniref:Uncharacterized protein n=1 Tax=Rhodopirellula baltica WH47 TaxID=991778 RepID=F2AZI4_RHOBT|nr:hypothetical protein RBWH47_05699 [Rhodopirellula baltica WH47]